MTLDKVFYHWSPSDRTNRILKVGLMPGQLSRDRLWRPPYVCLGTTAMDAWLLSGSMDKTTAMWNLWEVDVREQSGFEELYYDSGRVKEIRVYERIYKRNVWYVASRESIWVEKK